MAELRMEMHEPAFSLTYRVIYGDTDAGGVMYHANYLRLMEMGRTEFMRNRVGLPYSALEAEGLILPVTESYIRYKAPVRYDDLVEIRSCLAEVTKFSCRFHYRLSRYEAEERPTLLAKGFTKHACITREGRLTPFPEHLLQRIQAIMG
jgi:acyl-CoA thioester hydrolase